MKRIPSAVLAPVIVIVFSGGILVSMALNLWATESGKVAATFSTGEFQGRSNPADIRGSYTLSEIESNFDVPVRVLARAFGADTRPDPSAFQVKELETAFPPAADGGEIGTDSVRLFVARYLGLPYIPEESTRLPASSVELLRDRLLPADFASLQKIAVGLGPEVVSADHTADQTVKTVKGNTTFNDLLTWGMSRETISHVLGKPMGPTSQTVRDFCLAEGLSFSEMKAKLQTEVPAQ